MATAVVSAIGNGSAFHKGTGVCCLARDWYHGNGQPEASRSCWASVSGEIRISARCSFTARGLRCLRVKREGSCLGQWMSGLETRAARNVVIVATANKLARISWAVLVERKRLSSDAQSPVLFQLDEVGFENSLLRSLQKERRTKTQSNDVPENLGRNKVFHDRGDY